MTEDPDRAARVALARHRAVATLLVVAMAAITLATYAVPPSFATAILAAAAKAGFVGGIADWFAVTALFRHPLGLPIPHTAIIPRQKARLGAALGRFVATHVFTEGDVARALAGIDLPGILRRFLADRAAIHPAAEALAALLPRLLATIEDGRARRVLSRILPRLLGGPDAGRLVGRALRQLMASGRHQEVFSFILGQLKATLAEREVALEAAIVERVREQGGRLMGWALGASIARRVLGQVNAELERIEPGSSDLRAAFDEWMRREIDRIETEPERAAEIGRAVGAVLAHETVRAWVWDVWARLRIALERDAARPGGRAVAFLEGALGNLGALLAADEAARARLQRVAEGVAISLLPAAQEQLATFIADVIGSWDGPTIAAKLELRVGKDLQYVRINGTLVGFLVGGLAYAALHAIFGHAGF